MARRNWSWEETLMAFTLYYLLPAKEIDDKGTDIIQLANAIGRTPNAVALKAWNIAAHDPNRLASGRKGMSHGSAIDEQIWQRFAIEGDAMLEEGMRLLSQSAPKGASSRIEYAMVEIPQGETERRALRTERINQQYFRNNLLSNYSSRCCLTGIAVPELLIASHIKPWKDCENNDERLSASNGILLNALHDRAFDKGLMTINKNCEVILSSRLKRDAANMEWLFKVEGLKLAEPSIRPPAKEFIEYHNDVVFVA